MPQNENIPHVELGRCLNDIGTQSRSVRDSLSSSYLGKNVRHFQALGQKVRQLPFEKQETQPDYSALLKECQKIAADWAEYIRLYKHDERSVCEIKTPQGSGSYSVPIYEKVEEKRDNKRRIYRRLPSMSQSQQEERVYSSMSEHYTKDTIDKMFELMDARTDVKMERLISEMREIRSDLKSDIQSSTHSVEKQISESHHKLELQIAGLSERTGKVETSNNWAMALLVGIFILVATPLVTSYFENHKKPVAIQAQNSQPEKPAKKASK
jgi:hypothetical protein